MRSAISMQMIGTTCKTGNQQITISTWVAMLRKRLAAEAFSCGHKPATGRQTKRRANNSATVKESAPNPDVQVHESCTMHTGPRIVGVATRAVEILQHCMVTVPS